MTFGQPTGPPASAKQVQELLALLQEAGHSDFRDARGPMGFSQRQAAGRFTRDEAEAFIEQLRHEPVSVAGPLAAAPELRSVPTEQLAAELQRRGWIVVGP